MNIQNLFERDIFRAINGVVKADQLDESSVWQELDEFVVTRETDKHLRDFFEKYIKAIRSPHSPDVANSNGVWVSGFFGSGKSHFIKVLSYLLHNESHQQNGITKNAVDFFESKIQDAIVLGDIKRAVAAKTDVILFNIDSKANHRDGRDAILAVLLKVLNERQGFSGDHPHIAHLERHLTAQGKYDAFQAAFHDETGFDWTAERDAYLFHQDGIAGALARVLNQSQESALKLTENIEQSFALTVENFCKWVKEYLDERGPTHRIIFLIDEVGQFIGNDSPMMLKLQTITEELGTICRGRAWIVVTSQEDIDAILGEMQKSKANDFSKIQGRFSTRLSLSSANVDEVIQSRLLSKRPEVVAELEAIFRDKGDILRNQLTFTNCGMTLRPYRDATDFVKNYPFAPYQFQLVQKIFESIRKVGATGLHLSRGERSILDAFQSAGKAIAGESLGVLVPLYRFYPAIDSFLDTAVKRTIDQAGDNPSLEAFDVLLLKTLFLIRYVEELKGNVDNLVTFCLDQIDADRLALRRKIEESLVRLEKETLINRNGDIYFFLTNEERDVSREIKSVELGSDEEGRQLAAFLFEEILKDQRKYRFPVNKMDFQFNRICDGKPRGNQYEGALWFTVISPLNDEYGMFNQARCVLTSSENHGQVLVKLGDDRTLGRELRTYLQTETYIRVKNDGALPESTRRIFKDFGDENQQRKNRLTALIRELFLSAEFYVAGQAFKPKTASPETVLNEAFDYLVRNTFTKMPFLAFIKTTDEERAREIKAIVRTTDVAQLTLGLDIPEANPQAMNDVREYIRMASSLNKQIVLKEMAEKKFALRPYGWPELELMILLARLLVLAEISLVMDGAVVPLEKAAEVLTASNKWGKTQVVQRRSADPKTLQAARTLGKELFAETGPESEDGLTTFLKTKLADRQRALNGFKPLADTGNYPGKKTIDESLTLVNRLAGEADNLKFIERFLVAKDDLLDFADDYHDLEQFYRHQRQAWERLQKSYTGFELNQLELDRDPEAANALLRMKDILAMPVPYGALQEVESLISKVTAVNDQLLAARREQAITHITALETQLEPEFERARADAALKAQCLKPLTDFKHLAKTGVLLAHISQTQTEADKAFHIALEKLAEHASRAIVTDTAAPPPVVKKPRVVTPAKLAAKAYLETSEDVTEFLERLKAELDQAIANNERIQIR